MRLLVRIAALLLLAACHDSPEPPAPVRSAEGGTPALRQVSRLVVQESDALFLSSPGDFGVEPADGSFYVTDQFAGRVLQIARDGRVVRTFGRKGSGPGEFAQINLMFSRGDELFVHEGRQSVFHVFDRRTGAYRDGRRHEGIFRDVRLVGNTAWLGIQNMALGTAVARWDLQSDSVSYMVPLPREYRESQPLAGIYNAVFVVPWADSLLIGFQGSDDLHLATSDGAVLDTVAIPARARRGVPDDFARRMEKMQWPEMVAGASALFALGRLSGGQLGAVHLDPVPTGRTFSADGFISVLSANRRAACVDGRIPLSKDTPPRMLFRGDTLFVLQQRLTEAERAETTITGFVVSSDGCRWIPITR